MAAVRNSNWVNRNRSWTWSLGFPAQAVFQIHCELELCLYKVFKIFELRSFPSSQKRAVLREEAWKKTSPPPHPIASYSRQLSPKMHRQQSSFVLSFVYSREVAINFSPQGCEPHCCIHIQCTVIRIYEYCTYVNSFKHCTDRLDRLDRFIV
jgi:hypothetical protein